jgi:hypothetical protein
MRNLLILLVVVTMGCATVPENGTTWGTQANELPEPQSPTPTPCTDSLYLALKAQPLDALSQRQYEYFVSHEKACMEWQREAPRRKDADTRESAVSAWVGISILGAIATAVLVAQ